MQKAKHSGKKRSSAESGRPASWWTIWQAKPAVRLAVLTSVFSLYLAWYLRQPTMLPLEDESGSKVERITDWLFLPGLAAHTFQGFPPGQERMAICIAALAWVALAAWIGSVLVGWGLGLLRTPQECWSRWMLRTSLSALAGLSVLSTLVLAIGVSVGFSTRWPLVAGLATLAGLAYYLRSKIQQLPQPEAVKTSSATATEELLPDTPGSRWMMHLLPLSVVLLAGLYACGSAVPPWEFDVLEYHLQAPKQFFESSRIEFLENNVYGNMPLGVEMHALAGMVLFGGELGWWYGGLFGKTVIGMHAILAAMIVGGGTSLRFGRTAGWATAGLLLAMPGMAHVSMAGLIDAALGAYTVAALTVVCFPLADFLNVGRAQGAGLTEAAGPRGAAKTESGVFAQPTERLVGYAMLLGLFAGAAAASKYPGLVIVVLPAAASIAWLCYRMPSKGFALVAGFSGALLLTCGPWYLKNVWQTGNPFYPLAYDWFGGRGLTEDQVARWQRVHSPEDKPGIAAYSMAAVLRDARQLLVTSPFINLSLNFLSAIGAVVSLRHRRRAAWASWLVVTMAWILVVWWVATHRIDRFWMPIVPLQAWLAAVGLIWVARTSVSLSVGIAVFGIGLGTMQILAGVGPIDTRFFVPIKDIERESLVETYGSAANPTTAWINNHLTNEERVLSIGEVKAYLYRVPIIYATCFNDTPGEQGLRSRSPDEQRDYFQQEAITHVMVDWFEIERYRSPGNYGFSDWPQRADFDRMVEEGVLSKIESPFPADSVELFRVE